MAPRSHGSCQQGEGGNTFYIILSGTISVLITRPGERHPQELAQLTHPSYFGERALLEDAPRMATVKALTPLSLMSLQRDKFETLLGPLRDIIDVDRKKRSAETTMLAAALEEEVRAQPNESCCRAIEGTERAAPCAIIMSILSQFFRQDMPIPPIKPPLIPKRKPQLLPLPSPQGLKHCSRATLGIEACVRAKGPQLICLARHISTQRDYTLLVEAKVGGVGFESRLHSRASRNHEFLHPSHLDATPHVHDAFRCRQGRQP